jgi:hypothetical protein
MEVLRLLHSPLLAVDKAGPVLPHLLIACNDTETKVCIRDREGRDRMNDR